jgi:hypothetical protein
MSAHDTDIQWFIARDGKQHGPVSDLELKKLVELTHLKATDLLWRQGFADWRAAASVFPNIGQTAPAPPTSAPAPGAAAPPADTQASKPSFSAMHASAPAPGAGPSSTPEPTGLGSAGPAGTMPGPDTWRPSGEPRTEQPATRPLGTPVTARTAGPFTAPAPGAGPRPDARPDVRGSNEMMAPRRAYDPPPARGRKALLVATVLIAMTGAGALMASRYSDEIFTYVEMEDGDAPETPIVKADMMPSREPASTEAEAPQQAQAIETALQTPAQAPGPSMEDIDRKLQGRTMWVSIKREFPEWYQLRVSEVARLTADQKDQTEINRYLVGELVSLRRENAQHALAASTSRHKELAAAFLANLKQLAAESGDGCYDFISKGESSATIVSRIDDPAKSAELESQVVAIVTAISEGKKQPAQHAAPIKTDYDVLAGELGRLGWTQTDMQLFANPKELAKAPRSRVCSMLQDWFTAHLAIQDPSTQERLLFETLKPVISG